MLYKLMNRIISKSFFQMKGLPIEIKFSNVFEKEDAYCIYYSRSNDKNKFVIDIDWSLQKNRKAIIGGNSTRTQSYSLTSISP